MAFDGKRPVAAAALCIFEDLGYLLSAATVEDHRKRGAQQALIAKRVEQAEQRRDAMLTARRYIAATLSGGARGVGFPISWTPW